MTHRDHRHIDEILGKTLSSIKGGKDSEELLFETEDGEVYKMFHERDCCESVSIQDIIGDLQDLVGSPLLQAFESSNNRPAGINLQDSESETWTFYRFSTIKGSVVIRWYGSSNGYYSESVDFVKIET